MGVTCGAGEGCRKETERKLKCCAGQDEEVDVTCGAGRGSWAETERKLSVQQVRVALLHFEFGGRGPLVQEGGQGFQYYEAAGQHSVTPYICRFLGGHNLRLQPGTRVP